MAQDWTVALIHEIFPYPDGVERLRQRLHEARQAGAELAALPELPLNAWSPATRQSRDEDAEEPQGPRHQATAEAARNVGIGVLGGAIVRGADGRRKNRALLFNSTGQLAADYDKVHLPSEEGFWESDHYEPGERPAQPVAGFPLSVGLQVCSDLHRSQGCQMLAAGGAEVIFGPRATPPSSYENWKLVIRANALTAGAYVISVNRPAPECGVAIGGPSIVAAPDGSVALESTEPIGLVHLSRDSVRQARRDYPGYLAFRPGLYARGWTDLGDG